MKTPRPGAARGMRRKEEVARLLGVSPRTVQTIEQSALRKLRAALLAMDFEMIERRAGRRAG